MRSRETSTPCARKGCKYPFTEEAIFCSACKGSYHPTCSDLTPEAFKLSLQTAHAWKCENCLKFDATGDPVQPNKSYIITYVTSNPNKLRETLEILGEQYSTLFKSLDIDLPEYQGTAEEIAILKCRFAAEQIDGPVLVEDTGLGFDALKGLPGPYIKWFLKAVGAEGASYFKFLPLTLFTENSL
uniref:Inosine triphosphate pyrophosphatase n=1 Tax=Schistocephalus solidus TaxID=70667 RepID=A0A0V0J8F0_SCHSO